MYEAVQSWECYIYIYKRHFNSQMKKVLCVWHFNSQMKQVHCVWHLNGTCKYVAFLTVK